RRSRSPGRTARCSRRDSAAWMPPGCGRWRACAPTTCPRASPTRSCTATTSSSCPERTRGDVHPGPFVAGRAGRGGAAWGRGYGPIVRGRLRGRDRAGARLGTVAGLPATPRFPLLVAFVVAVAVAGTLRVWQVVGRPPLGWNDTADFVDSSRASWTSLGLW